MNVDQWMQTLNAPTAQERLNALKEILPNLEKPQRTGKDCNNHIHTTYSFSPYSPTKAVCKAYVSGLSTCGIIDHDSISGAREFIEAGHLLNLPTTIGFELRVSFKNTAYADKKINNPDQKGNVYCTVHGVPHSYIDAVTAFLRPVCEARGQRNRKMVKNINGLFAAQGISLDYDNDVLPLSNAVDGGSVTERHLLFALSHKLIQHYGRGTALVDALKNNLALPLSPKVETLLSDKNNLHYDYDLLGALKAELVGKIYIDATDECPDVRDLVRFADSIGAICSYAYLGDVGDSVTGDKKTQKFEDDFLDDLIDYCKGIGFRAISYMPSRNTLAQLQRVQALCEQHGLLQISGEDINQPRQPFICEAARADEFAGLIDTTWALIGNEAAATRDLNRAFFSPATIKTYPDLHQRIAAFKQIGLEVFA